MVYEGSKGESYAGIVADFHPNGMCSNQCDDGESIPHIPQPYIMPLNGEMDTNGKEQAADVYLDAETEIEAGQDEAEE